MYRLYPFLSTGSARLTCSGENSSVRPRAILSFEVLSISVFEPGQIIAHIGLFSSLRE